jgi:hypothetical protein
VYGQWDGEEPFPERFEELLRSMVSSEGEQESYLRRAEMIEAAKAGGLGVTLEDVAKMKLLADAFFLRQFRSLQKLGPTDE